MGENLKISKATRASSSFSSKLTTIPETHEHNGNYGGLPRFNIMFAGKKGLGKTTFINSMWPIQDVTLPFLDFQVSKLAYKDPHILWCLTIIDTPGYDASTSNDKVWNTITTYIDSKLRRYELHTTTPDERVHCVVYFIDPSGLCSLDMAILRNLHDKVNILPVIAKSDTLTILEARHLQSVIVQKLTHAKINIYNFTAPKFLSEFFQRRLPFKLMGSTVISHKDKEAVRIREYPWGNANIQCIEYSDFVIFELAIRSNLNKMVEGTNKFRVTKKNYQDLLLVTKSDVQYVINILKCRKMRMQDDLRQTEIDIALFEKQLDTMPDD